MEKMYKVYLDDVRTPVEKEWVVARNYEEFVKVIQELGLKNINVISLDHDLGESAIAEYYANAKPNNTIDYENILEKTGMDCCKFLVNESMDTNIPLPQVFVHSANPVGRVNMMGLINNYLKSCGLPETCERIKIKHTV
jgi:hypothetical protein